MSEMPMYRPGQRLTLLNEMRRDRLGFLQRAAAEMGDVFRMKISIRSVVVSLRPEDVAQVLVDHHRNYSKQTRGYKMLRLVLGPSTEECCTR